jgi:hypothetical protein
LYLCLIADIVLLKKGGISRRDLLKEQMNILRASAGALREVTSVRTSPAGCAAGPQVTGERLTVTLIPAAREDLQQLQQRTNLSKTDLANRAIQLYEFFDAQLRAGYDLVSRDNETGETQLVRLLEAPAGQASLAAPAWQTPASPAFARRGPAGRHRHPYPPSRRRPAITGRFLQRVGLQARK